MNSQELLEKEGRIVPFSNGTEHAEWQDANCECCSKCYQPPVRNGYPKWPSDKTMRRHVEEGRECAMKYAIDWSWMDGTMPVEPAEKIGWTREGKFPARCLLWSERGNGGNPRGPRKPKPVPDNQMVLGFEFSEIAQGHKPLVKEIAGKL